MTWNHRFQKIQNGQKLSEGSYQRSLRQSYAFSMASLMNLPARWAEQIAHLASDQENFSRMLERLRLSYEAYASRDWMQINKLAAGNSFYLRCLVVLLCSMPARCLGWIHVIVTSVQISCNASEVWPIFFEVCRGGY